MNNQPACQSIIVNPHKKGAAIVVVKHTILIIMIIDYSDDNKVGGEYA
jgi:hypothetical protein